MLLVAEWFWDVGLENKFLTGLPGKVCPTVRGEDDCTQPG